MIEANDVGSLSPALGPDLVALLEAHAGAIVKLAPITALPSPVRQRAAFAIELADGSRLKARRFRSAQRAELVVALRGRIDGGFAPILARRGEGMLLAWIEGRTLDTLAPLPPQELRRCGRMLGALHALACEPHPGGTAPSPDDHFAKLLRNAGELRQAGLLDAALAQRALAAADAARPKEPTLGLIHKDFCAENLVQRADGSLVCIDDATLSTGPHDLDVARSWYRFPLSAQDFEHFAAGYEERRSLAEFRRHFAFWATCVLVGSAATRLRARAPGVQAPLERLRALHGGG
jgi:Ser/Thr protein kinase RdoA (MazF antagonist)